MENKEVKGVRSVERFRKKFEDDPATFMLIDRAARGQTETILFNIDIEGFSNKDKTAVLRVFAKMFYNHLGFYGENLKVAMLERYIDQQGKTEEFCRVFEEKKGKSWLEMRRAFAFNGKFIIPTLMEETDKIMKAQIARGADFESGNLIKKVKSLVPLLVPLFISAFRRANDLAMAMEARCYRGGEHRTKMKPLLYHKRDRAAYAVLFAYSIICVYFGRFFKI